MEGGERGTNLEIVAFRAVSLSFVSSPFECTVDVRINLGVSLFLISVLLSGMCEFLYCVSVLDYLVGSS